MNPVDIQLDRLFPLKEGSVQKIFGAPGFPDAIVCEITDRVSVFDVGPLLEIPGSGLLRALMRHQIYEGLAKPETWKPAIFEELRDLGIDAETLGEFEKRGVENHHGGIWDSARNAFVAGSPERPGNFLLAERFGVIEPGEADFEGERVHDYSVYLGQDGFIVPLEMICRTGLPENASLLKRYAKAGAEERKALERKTGGSRLEAWQRFEKPLIDFTSKYESMDRPLSTRETFHIFSLCGVSPENCAKRMKAAGVFLKHYFASLCLELWDFKLEFAVRGGRLTLADTVDLDSCRTTLARELRDGENICHFSKQAIRDYFINFHPGWMDAVDRLKKECRVDGRNFQREFWRLAAESETHRPPVPNERFLHVEKKKQETLLRRMLGETDLPRFQRELAEIAREERGLASGTRPE